MPTPPRFNLLGVGVHALDYQQATDCIIEAAREKRRFAVTALAVHGVMTGRDDPNQRTRLNRLDLITPDGQPVRWALNWLHKTKLTDRVYGPFLTLRVCERAASEGLSIFLYGSDTETLTALSTALTQKCPGLNIAGTRVSRFRPATEAEWSEDVAAIRASKADIVFCGLGCPRQETWVYEMRAQIDRPLIAVGAAFAFWSGHQAMAPAWMQRSGLEWLFRFSREPLRLWRRYLILNPRYLAGLARQTLASHTFDPPATPPEPPQLRWS
jgi:exopolysaccharide biosynthesis WecB/TagA/CpsF family protein